MIPYDLEREHHEEMEAEIKRIQKENKKKIQETLENREKETARQMLLKGLDIKLICDTTGLSEAQIKALTKEGGSLVCSKFLAWKKTRLSVLLLNFCLPGHEPLCANKVCYAYKFKA